MHDSNWVVACQGVSRHYRTPGGTVKALDEVSMSVAPGEFMAVAGTSGSGKSTLLNLIGMLDRPTEGQILINGREVGGYSRAEQARIRREEIGFIFQAYNLIPVLTVIENVEYVMLLLGWSRRQRRGRAHEVLEEVGLAGMARRRPNELSGGQQQRVAVARAIAARPALVLADEPTANLDSARSIDLLEMMEDLNRKHHITFIFSSHDPNIISRAHRLVYIVDGKIDREEKRR